MVTRNVNLHWSHDSIMIILSTIQFDSTMHHDASLSLHMVMFSLKDTGNQIYIYIYIYELPFLFYVL